jgi:cytochrome P450 family 4
VQVFDKHSTIFIENLSNLKDKEIDIFPLIALCTLDIICETSLGVEIHAQTNSESEYVKAVKEISSIVSARHYNFLTRFEWIFRLTSIYGRQKKCLKILHGFTDSVIVARRAELKRSNMNATEPKDDVGSRKKMALLDVLIQSTINGQPLTDMDIREEVDTFTFEGHDTTTSGIAFCLYNIAKYPQIQQNVFNEIRNVLGDVVERNFTLKDLNDLNYLELVIKESLRMFPPVPFYGRRMRKDTYIS